MNNQSFKPCYVWPSENIPFKILYNDDSIRIFIIENLQFNFNWLDKFKFRIKQKDIFFVINTIHYSEWLIQEASITIENLGIDKNKFIILCNHEFERNIFENNNFRSAIVNRDSLIDNTEVMKPSSIQKIYNAIYVARLINQNRHYLTKEILEIAYVSSSTYGEATVDNIPSHKYMNNVELSKVELALKINEAHCGLALSEFDNGEFPITNYLLCGIPVVATKSETSRSYWLNSENSIFANADSEEIRNAVNKISSMTKDAQLIRNECLEKIQNNRNTFSVLIDEIFKNFNINFINSEIFLNHKIKGEGIFSTCKPSFEYIFEY